MNYKLETLGGEYLPKVVAKAKSIATDLSRIVEFTFNGITVLVDQNSDAQHIHRYYDDALLMGWDSVGPVYRDEYPESVKSLVEKKRMLRKAENAKREQEYREKQDREKADFQSRIVGVEMEYSDKAAWDSWKDAQKGDGYGLACFEYAEGWAKLMQVEMDKGSTLKDCATNTSHQLGFLGITGFMYGMAVQLLAKCWLHGEALRLWHNAEYGQQSDGVVNPAVLSISA